MSPVSARPRHLMVLRFFMEGPPEETECCLGGLTFRITVHLVGWDDRLAASLLKRYDGACDGIVISSRDRLGFAGHEVLIPRIRRLAHLVRKTAVYIEADLEKMFTSWCVRRLVKTEPQFFRGRNLLFHCAGYTSMSRWAQEEGARIAGLDPLVILGQPLKLKGERALGLFYKCLRRTASFSEALLGRHEAQKSSSGWAFPLVANWIGQCDVFVSNLSLINGFPHYEMLQGKTLLVDYLTPELKAKLEANGVGRIVEWYPRIPATEGLRPSFSLLKAIIDQIRLATAPDTEFDDFALQFINQQQISPARVTGSGAPPRRCAFVIHPLSRNMIFNAPGMSWLKSGPESLKRGIEMTVARAPTARVGQITGIKSAATGQEVICDLYGLFATPREMLAMDEEAVYARLVRAAERAHAAGAVLIGLGAYTKVVGDSGVTVARRAPLPVTTGNSYTVAATLWAAFEMVKRMGLVPLVENSKKLDGRAMVVGATGSIGRVCSLLLARAFTEVTLVAPTPAKLLELKDEVEAYAPGTRVQISTNPNHTIADADLIITATSARGERVLDILQAKAGAVICDCSRPLDISVAEAQSRPDVIVIESGEIDLPGDVRLSLDIGLPGQSVYACLAETVLLAMEGRYENFSLSRQLSFERVKEIYRIGLKHGARLSTIRGPLGVIGEAEIAAARAAALEVLNAAETAFPVHRLGETANELFLLQ